ncbi:MAG: hypothetical protein U1F16_02085 [Turneriella sp.]
MWLNGSGHTDPARIINATYQALEVSDEGRAKNRHANLYQPVVGATQWHWDPTMMFDHNTRTVTHRSRLAQDNEMVETGREK